jgi:hypothetical protein
MEIFAGDRRHVNDAPIVTQANLGLDVAAAMQQAIEVDPHHL